jgi:hypothetical protein
MNKNPSMEKASENITKICNPTESDIQRSKRISQEMSQFIGELQ